MLWENLYNALENMARQIRLQYKNALIRDDKIASGDLLNSVDYIIEKNGGVYEVSLDLEWYWKILEEGVNGTENNVGSPYSFSHKTVNIDAMKNWIKIKPVIPRPINGKLPTENQLAFLIGRKIARDGLEPHHYLEDITDRLNREMENAISDAIDKDIMTALDFMFG